MLIIFSTERKENGTNIWNYWENEIHDKHLTTEQSVKTRDNFFFEVNDNYTTTRRTLFPINIDLMNKNQHRDEIEYTIQQYP